MNMLERIKLKFRSGSHVDFLSDVKELVFLITLNSLPENQMILTFYIDTCTLPTIQYIISL